MRGGWGLEGGAALIGLDVETGATRENHYYKSYITY
jgi:hypothetical protein